MEAQGEVYLTVQFEDGPERGLAADVAEEDVCDPQFWHFEAVHKKQPRAKVLFPEGHCLYILAMPKELKGTLVDEDGDTHVYTLEEAAKEVLEGGPPGKASPAAPPATSEAPGKETPKDPAKAPRKRRRQVADSDSDEDWAAPGRPGRRATRPPPAKPAKPSKPPAAAPAEPDPAAAEAPPVPAQEVPQAAVDGGTNLEEAIAPQPLQPEPPPGEEPAREDAICPTPPAVAEQVAQGVLQEEAPAASQEAAKDEGPAATQDGSAGGYMSFSRANTARSTCKSCGEAIQRHELRYGLRGYSMGRTVTFYSHVRCFQERITVEYCAARRGKCKGSGTAFEPGDIRIGFNVGGTKSWWLPAEAARWTALAVAEGLELPEPASLSELDEEHRGPLMELLRNKTPPSIALRREVAKKSGRGGQSGRKRKAADASAPAASPAVAASAPASAAAAAPEAASAGAEPTAAAATLDGEDSDGLEMGKENLRSVGPPLDLDDEDSFAVCQALPRVLDEDSDLEVVLAA